MKHKTMYFGTVFLGLAFFFNPYFAVVDVLPDFIGAFIVCLGLSRLALLHPTLREARNGFLKVAAADAVKNLGLLVIFGLGTDAEQPIALLIAAFAAAILELLFLIPAMRALFDGLYSLASHYDCKALYADADSGISRTDLMHRLTVIFLVVRETVCLLPEFTALTTSSFSDSRWDRIYEYIGVMRAIACFIVALLGICWLVLLLLYYRRLRAEKAMLADLDERYRIYYDAHPGIAVTRRQGAALLLMGIGTALTVDFYVDLQNVIPDVLAGILMAVGALIPAVSWKKRGVTAALAVAYTAVAAVSSELSRGFLLEYSISEIGKNQAADAAYRTMWMLSLLEFAVFVALLAALLLLLRDVIRTWAGYRAKHAKSEFEERYRKGFLADFDGNLLLCAFLGVLSGLFSFLYDYIKTAPGKGIYHLLEFLWIFDFCAAVVFAVAVGVLLARIFGEIKNRYRFD